MLWATYYAFFKQTRVSRRVVSSPVEEWADEQDQLIEIERRRYDEGRAGGGGGGAVVAAQNANRFAPLQEALVKEFALYDEHRLDVIRASEQVPTVLIYGVNTGLKCRPDSRSCIRRPVLLFSAHALTQWETSATTGTALWVGCSAKRSKPQWRLTRNVDSRPSLVSFARSTVQKGPR